MRTYSLNGAASLTVWDSADCSEFGIQQRRNGSTCDLRRPDRTLQNHKKQQKPLGCNPATVATQQQSQLQSSSSTSQAPPQPSSNAAGSSNVLLHFFLILSVDLDTAIATRLHFDVAGAPPSSTCGRRLGKRYVQQRDLPPARAGIELPHLPPARQRDLPARAAIDLPHLQARLAAAAWKTRSPSCRTRDSNPWLY